MTYKFLVSISSCFGWSKSFLATTTPSAIVSISLFVKAISYLGTTCLKHSVEAYFQMVWMGYLGFTYLGRGIGGSFFCLPLESTWWIISIDVEQLTRSKKIQNFQLLPLKVFSRAWCICRLSGSLFGTLVWRGRYGCISFTKWPLHECTCVHIVLGLVPRYTVSAIRLCQLTCLIEANSHLSYPHDDSLSKLRSKRDIKVYLRIIIN